MSFHSYKKRPNVRQREGVSAGGAGPSNRISSSAFWRGTELTLPTLINVCVCSFLNPEHRMTSQSVWPPSVKRRWCHICFCFICWESKTVILTQRATSQTDLPAEMCEDGFMSELEGVWLCAWHRRNILVELDPKQLADPLSVSELAETRRRSYSLCIFDQKAQQVPADGSWFPLWLSVASASVLPQEDLWC